MEVRIYVDPLCNAIKIGIREERPDGMYYAKPLKLEFERVEPELYYEPTLQLPGGSNFLDAMAEALDRQGVKTDKDAKIQGTLEATKYHLEDMRKLLKIK